MICKYCLQLCGLFVFVLIQIGGLLGTKVFNRIQFIFLCFLVFLSFLGGGGVVSKKSLLNPILQRFTHMIFVKIEL